MTHKDIYNKFLIAYDKANVTSSYPSLTNYEIATLLDRAYLALIALKLTGNNPRGASFETDLKSIEDLQPLIQTTSTLTTEMGAPLMGLSNRATCNLPDNLLYFIQAKASVRKQIGDKQNNKAVIIKLVDHKIAQRFMTSMSNIPWVKDFVGYIENNQLIYMFDGFKYSNVSIPGIDDNPWKITGTLITYIRLPNRFAAPEEEALDNDAVTPMITVTRNYNGHLNEIYIDGYAQKKGINIASMMFYHADDANKTYANIVNTEKGAIIEILPACTLAFELPIYYDSRDKWTIPPDPNNPDTVYCEGIYNINIQYTQHTTKVYAHDTINPNIKVFTTSDVYSTDDTSTVNITIPDEFKHYATVKGNYLIINPNTVDRITIPILYEIDGDIIIKGVVNTDILYSEKDYLAIDKIPYIINQSNRIGYFRLNEDRLVLSNYNYLNNEGVVNKDYIWVFGDKFSITFEHSQ